MTETVETAQPVRAPTFNLISFGVAIANTNCSIVGLQQIPLATSGGITGAGVEPVVILNLAMPALKDLSLLVAQAINDFEKVHGPVETEFSKERAAK